MKPRYRHHTVGLKFSKPVTEAEARAYLNRLQGAIGAFELLGEMAWNNAGKRPAVLIKTTVKKRG